MRNLKKFLALVLAMMMTFSLMVTVNAATTSDFTDAESITDEFTEAVAVLEGLEVFEGYPDKTFKPKNSITRAEVATIVYRLATGDVEGNQAHLYKDYATFTDVTADHWAAGYINYCANAQWIAGYGNGKFGPNDSVTGYQAAAMILRAVGYGKNKEFTGPTWQVQVANFTRSLGMLDNVNKTTYASTLNSPAPRELVAEILFQAGLLPVQKWTILNGYEDNAPCLAWQNFTLSISGWRSLDKWGRPGYYWFSGTNLVTSGAGKNVVATIELEPDLEFKTTLKECDVAHELDISTNATYALYVNSNTAITSRYLIEATDTVTKVGGQGRISEFYKGMAHPWYGEFDGFYPDRLQNRAVMIDTYLATVTQVTERVVDPAGHEIFPSYLYLDVHDGQATGPANKTDAYEPTAAGDAVLRNTSAHIASKSGANWEYSVGDKVLVQGYTDYTQRDKDIDGTTGLAPVAPATGLENGSGLNHQWTGAVGGVETSRNRAAFETNILGTDDTKLDVLKKVDPKLGKQTVTYWNQDKHTVDGTDYNDAMTLFLDVAGTTTGTTYAWYFDDETNLIGIDSIPDNVNYGVITSIYSAFNQGSNDTTGTAKAVANVLYANGSTGTVTINRFLMSGSVIGTHTFNTQMTNTSNTVDLVPVYDHNSPKVMQGGPRTSTDTNAATNGWLYVAPVIGVNAVENGQMSAGYHGILRGNLFKFVESSNGGVTAIEVGGSTVSANTGVYAGHYSNTAAQGKIYKSTGYLTFNSADSPVNANVWLDANTSIMIRANATSTAVSCYNLDTLPGDVNLLPGSEVDWADTNNDGRADYLYVVGTSEGSLTYGLFYYNGGAAQWNGVDGRGTITGWLNGDPTTVTFGSEKLFNRVKNSQAYAGHLFALQLTNGMVTALMENGGNNYLLQTTSVSTVGDAAKGSGLSIATPAGTDYFGLGSENSKYGNPYTVNTQAIYARDNGASVTYNASARSITTGGNTYYLTGTSKVVGLGMGVNQETAILDYLEKSNANDVTIVYENNGTSFKSIVEIYVATDPNVTPPTVTTFGSVSATMTAYDTVSYTFTGGTNGATGVTGVVQYRLAGSSYGWSTVKTTSHGSVGAGTTTAATTHNFAHSTPATYEVRVVITGTDAVTDFEFTLISDIMIATF